MNFFVGSSSFNHQSKPTLGVLLINLGTPDAPTPRALKPYLKEFLWDRRVIEGNRLVWWWVLNAIILPRRPKTSAKLYEKIWTDKGSPLLIHTEEQTRIVREKLANLVGSPLVVEYGMRYGNPSIPSALERMKSQGVTRILMLPLYPQYSATSTGTAFDVVADVLKTWRWVPELRTIMQFHDDAKYISSVVNSIREAWQRDGKPEKLLLSFHGIPKQYFLDGDPYYCHCLKTGRLIVEGLELEPDQYLISFQSRFRNLKWLEPSTESTLRTWARAGIKSVDVVCPGFICDCLETIEEIDVENRTAFLEEGGQTFRYIPALNEREDFTDALVSLVLRNASDWIISKIDWDQMTADKQASKTKERQLLAAKVFNS